MTDFDTMIDKLEENILSDAAPAVLARQAGLSLYEFRRIFRYLAGVPIGEYIRKRRLSLAAEELASGGKSVAALAETYGYASAAAFSRAFREFHGVSPSEVAEGGCRFRCLTRLHTATVTHGGESVSYTIRERAAFSVRGFCAASPLSDTECCESVWEAFYASPVSARVTAEGEPLFAVYENEGNRVRCTLGTAGGDFPDGVEISAATFAVFPMTGSNDETVNRFYRIILQSWFDSSGYERCAALPNIEVFPADMSRDDFSWEIWIPVRRVAHA